MADTLRKDLAGQRWSDEHGEVRICAVVEGYIVARRPGCMPFIESPAKFCERFRPPSPQPGDSLG